MICMIRATLIFFFSHLHDVSQYSDHNQMTAKNLGLMIGPNISWNPHQYKKSELGGVMMSQNKIITYMIENIQTIKKK